MALEGKIAQDSNDYTNDYDEEVFPNSDEDKKFLESNEGHFALNKGGPETWQKKEGNMTNIIIEGMCLTSYCNIIN